MINAAVKMASSRTGVTITNLEFNVVGGPVDAKRAEMLTLASNSFQRKVAAALNYDEVRAEVRNYLADHGVDAFRTENFRPASDPSSEAGIPHYERHAHQLVQQGVYQRAVVFEQHVAPLLNELNEFSRQTPAFSSCS